jgi:large subunit ribosomal protein L23
MDLSIANCPLSMAAMANMQLTIGNGQWTKDMDNTNVIIKPLITEKSTHLQNTRNCYAFKVNPSANKQQIKAAVEHLYDVKVADVRTMNRRGKPRRTKYKLTTTSEWKRAIVQLAEDSKIELF